MVPHPNSFVRFKLLKKLIKKIRKAEVQGLLSEALTKHTAFVRMLARHKFATLLPRAVS